MQTLYNELARNDYSSFTATWKKLKQESALNLSWTPTDGKFSGYTLMNIAVITGAVTFVAFMIENGVTVTGEHLQYALTFRRTPVVEELLDHLPPEQLNAVYNRTTPLITAVKTDDLDYVKLLVEKNADPNYINLTKGVLSPALSYSNITIGQWLLSKNANPDLVDYSGNTPLSMETIKLLIHPTTDTTRWMWLLSVSDPNANTVNNPLLLSVLAQNNLMTFELIKAGASPLIQGELLNNGVVTRYTALDVAPVNVRQLLHDAADVHRKTPLQLCDSDKRSPTWAVSQKRLRRLAEELGVSHESVCEYVRKYETGGFLLPGTAATPPHRTENPQTSYRGPPPCTKDTVSRMRMQ